MRFYSWYIYRMPWYEWWCVWFFSDMNRGRQTKTEKVEKPYKSVQVRTSFERISFIPNCMQGVSISRLLKSGHWSCLGLSIHTFRHVLHLIFSRIFIQRHMFSLWKCLGTNAWDKFVYTLKVKASIVCKSFDIGNKHSISEC